METDPAAGRDEELLKALQERAKELNCLYQVDEILNRSDGSPDPVFRELIEALPQGWQFPDVCRARIRIGDLVYASPDLVETAQSLHADIRVDGEPAGDVTVFYAERRPRSDEGPFLKEERRLINAIADRISLFLLQRGLRTAHENLESALKGLRAHERPGWLILIEFLGRTDPDLVRRLTRKMINYMSWNGIDEAGRLLHETAGGSGATGSVEGTDEETDSDNRPLERVRGASSAGVTAAAFDLAARRLADAEIMALVQAWIREEKSSFLIRTLEDPDADLSTVTADLERYESSGVSEEELPAAIRTTLRVSLLRRFFTDRLEFLNLAKPHVEVKDFYDLARHLIYPPRSHGKLGGKGAGLFLAHRILFRHAASRGVPPPVRVPRTWYMASDGVLEFMGQNDLYDLYNHKYMEIGRIRQDYPHVVQLFKNSEFPPDLEKGLAVALDDFENRPLIVRSSSLLEDRTGSAFSGKYKSLFLANQGTKRQRISALKDAIAEVYASIFGPDPIEYRAERGFLDFREEMGILIQEVVGRRVGPYFLPAFSGVGFSTNEFRWSPRIRRGDGLLRLVPGLGTRAVDRLSDDYPVLISPGQPGLRVNVTPAETVRYSPRKVDVIDLARNEFNTVDLAALLRAHGDEYPMAGRLVSIVDSEGVHPPAGLGPDWEKDTVAVTFHGLTADTPFLSQMKDMLDLLRTEFKTPVDIEFAHDGEHLYLLQCRAQSYRPEHAPAPIPRDIPRERILFSAHRFISNGSVSGITHIVYVDPDAYAELETRKDLLDVARAVGRLNQILPKRQFILLGPGRWGSRGDIKLGVGVTYSDINNAAVLMEIARQKGNYTPELSFGTHFFQDLVEADIRYIPLYPDEEENLFNETFLKRARNVFPELVPELAHLAPAVRVIDVPGETGGSVLEILMNAEIREAVGLLARPVVTTAVRASWGGTVERPSEDHWRWRFRMAESLAEAMDADRFGVHALYVIGSTKNATAGPNSDLDILVHFKGTGDQRATLLEWLGGWSVALAEVNYQRTGYRSEGLLDIHIVTDEDITRQTSFAVKIGAVTDAARPLPLKARPAP